MRLHGGLPAYRRRSPRPGILRRAGGLEFLNQGIESQLLNSIQQVELHRIIL
jgi:hypothetical protein